jgi:hypothetical protein
MAIPPVGEVLLDQPPTHWPLTQLSPLPHGAQATPPVPQLKMLSPAWQKLPSQQPVGHLRAPHTAATQAPATQSWPFWQTEHASPVSPQAVTLLPGWHETPSQHPGAHEPSGTQVPDTQAPPTQLSPAAQTVHAAPFAPQAAVSVPGAHAPLLQHPPLHWPWPVVQCWHLPSVAPCASNFSCLRQ